MKVLLLVLAVFITSSCATMFTGTQYRVLVRSRPSGADLEVTNNMGTVVHQGISPATMTLNVNDAPFTVDASLAGYYHGQAVLDYSYDFVHLANIGLVFIPAGLILSPVGFLVDAATGSMWKLDRAVTVHLERRRDSGD